MKKMIYFLILIGLSLIFIITPILSYYKTHHFILISGSGLLIILIILFSKHYLLNERRNKLFYKLIPFIYIIIVFLTGASIYLSNAKKNTPDPLPYFNLQKISANFNNEKNVQKLNIKLLYNYFRKHPVKDILDLSDTITSNKITSQKLLKDEADSVVNSYYSFLNYPAVKLNKDLNWNEDPYHNRSWNFELHKMKYIAKLTEAYKQFGDIIYLKKAEQLILNWISGNSKYLISPPSESFSWGDQTTALRLSYWLYFWETWVKTPLFTPEKMKIILSSMIAHAERLSDPKFYTYHHNHGIDQDISLLSMTLIFPEINKATDWRRLALNRLKDQIWFAVSPNGIHMEHSPAYHFYGLMQIQRINSLLSKWHLKDDLKLNLDKIIIKMIHYIKFIVQPNGQIVPVGDTNVEFIDKYRDYLKPCLNMDEGLKYILTNGSSGYLSDTAIAFPEEGYAIIRNFDGGKLPFSKSFYLFFTSAAHKMHAHKHFDDLSFVLSYGGHPLLIDPGAYSYKKDEFRSYVLSQSTHNSITVDGKNFDKFNLSNHIYAFSTPENWNTTLEKFQTDSIHTFIQASHKNYSGFITQRQLIYIKPEIIIIKDSVIPDSTVKRATYHKFEQFFHASNDIEMKVDQPGKEVSFLIPSTGKTVMRILQLLNDRTTTKIYKGNKKPIQGWNTLTYDNMVPAPVVDFEKQGYKASFITAIELNRNLTNKDIKQSDWPVLTYNPDNESISIRTINKKIVLDMKSIEVR